MEENYTLVFCLPVKAVPLQKSIHEKQQKDVWFHKGAFKTTPQRCRNLYLLVFVVGFCTSSVFHYAAVFNLIRLDVLEIARKRKGWRYVTSFTG